MNDVIPINDMAPVTATEAWQPTMRLRWRLPERFGRCAETANPHLEQMWQSNLGAQKWVKLPLVFTDQEPSPPITGTQQLEQAMRTDYGDG